MTEADFSAALAGVLKRVVPEFRALTECARLSGGANQETYRLLVDTASGARKLVLRRATGGGALSAGPGLAIEAQLMRAARKAGVPEPDVLHVLDKADGVGDGFIAEWLDGETLGTRIVRGAEFEAIRGRLARQCGEILARIHSIDLAAAGLDGRLQRKDTPTYVRELWQQYQRYGVPQPMIDYTARWLLEHLPPPTAPCLVHNDFRNGNLMIAPDRGVVAVLDWELAHVGDPLRDLGWLCTNSWRFGKSDLPVGGFGAIEDLLDGYASLSGRRVDPAHLKWWIVFGSFWWSVGTLTMAQAWRLGLDRSVERAAVGRRSSECQVDCVNLLIPAAPEPVAAPPASAALDLPRADELLGSVRDFLREDVLKGAKGRTSFLARVAANSLDIVARELALGPAHRAREACDLEALLGHAGTLEALRGELAQALRDGSMPLERAGLADCLRRAVTAQIAVDQPDYSGVRGQGSGIRGQGSAKGFLTSDP